MPEEGRRNSALAGMESADPAIDLTRADMFDDRSGPGVDQLDFKPRIFPAEVGDRARHDGGGQQWRCRDHDLRRTLAFREVVRIARRGFQVVDDLRRDVARNSAPRRRSVRPCAWCGRTGGCPARSRGRAPAATAPVAWCAIFSAARVKLPSSATCRNDWIWRIVMFIGIHNHFL